MQFIFKISVAYFSSLCQLFWEKVQPVSYPDSLIAEIILTSNSNEESEGKITYLCHSLSVIESLRCCTHAYFIAFFNMQQYDITIVNLLLHIFMLEENITNNSYLIINDFICFVVMSFAQSVMLKFLFLLYSSRCQKCNFVLTATFVMNLFTRLYDELDALGGNDINQIEMFIAKYSKTLHKNHYIFLSAKHSLCQLYGKIDGYLINELSVEQLKRKETYCRDLLEVIDILEPGSSRLRGVILYELHAPIMLQITQEMQLGTMKPVDFKRRLKEVIQMLKKSYEILKLEPDGSQESEMAVAAKTAISSMGM